MCCLYTRVYDQGPLLTKYVAVGSIREKVGMLLEQSEQTCVCALISDTGVHSIGLIISAGIIRDLGSLEHSESPSVKVLGRVAHSGSECWFCGLHRPLHRSLSDFLSDSERSQAFFIDMKERNDKLAITCLDIMERHLKHDICNSGDIFLPNPGIEEVKERMKKFQAFAVCVSALG